jgi:uncharacterized tellurite resistance protein B-like protein
MHHQGRKLELIQGGKEAAQNAAPIHQIAEDLERLIKASNQGRYDMLSYLLEIALDEAVRETNDREQNPR